MGCKKPPPSIVQGTFLNIQKIRNVDIKVPRATLIGPHDYLTIMLCVISSRAGECHNQTRKSISHLQGGTVNPNGLIILCVCTVTLYMAYALSPNLLISIIATTSLPCSPFSSSSLVQEFSLLFTSKQHTTFPGTITPLNSLSYN